ncbi:MAG: hypothetical protein ACRD2W_25600 [Acidimicrobiales bacterium]
MTLVAKGAAVSVPVEVTCGPGVAFAGLSVRVNQARGSHLATGFGGTSALWCDGLPHIVDVLVQASSGAFKTGDALVTARVFACPGFPGLCGEDEDAEVAKVTK